MASSDNGTLTAFRLEVLGAFTDIEAAYLTGGAALGHFGGAPRAARVSRLKGDGRI